MQSSYAAVSRLALAAIVGVLAAGGCGSGSGESPPEPATDSDEPGELAAGGAGGQGGAAVAPPAETEPLAPACGAFDGVVGREAMVAHLRRLEAIAEDHGGNRAALTEGYDASVAYVKQVLEAAHLKVTTQRFSMPVFRQLGPGTLEVVAPKRRVFRPAKSQRRVAASPGAEHTVLRSSPPGDVTAELVGIDLPLARGAPSTSGCEASDFLAAAEPPGASLVKGKIALMRRGGCPFGQKVRNAEAAGAVGALVVNEGGASAEKRGLIAGELADKPDHGLHIPALFATNAVGVELARLLGEGPVELHLVADTEWRVGHVDNVLSEVPGRRRAEVLMFGAHLDSVEEGPGINDNGSGSAALLEIARPFGACTPERTLRFAWWGAEEPGLIGSDHYVAHLAADEKARIRGYVNLDMLASPNHVYELADGDGSRFGKRGPGSSAELEQFFHDDLAAAGVPFVEIAFHFRSDYRAFHRAGIGVAELDAGADDKKTPAQVARFGGVAGQILDPCYHKACDQLAHLDLDVLGTIAGSVARLAWHFGAAGEGLVSVPPPPPPASAAPSGSAPPASGPPSASAPPASAPRP